ncbi:AAA family ATPase [Pseudoalteromonas neustonica]|uniref:AAA family ATPase n=1 Tax=Pseudoalteromonas neustonica TaxID=1840331 RepID=A0ABU9U6C4_9GAMM
MSLTIQKFSRNTILPTGVPNLVCLKPDNWDDFGFKTIFTVTVFDENCIAHELGNVKIGYVGQLEGYTSEQLPDRFSGLGEGYFSLGQDYEYYQKIVEGMSEEFGALLLSRMKDVVKHLEYLTVAEGDAEKLNADGIPSVFNVSLLRVVTPSQIKNQFSRILAGGKPLTEYDFFYEKPANDRYSGVKVEFEVNPDQKPSSNIHILIGRNGVGKTTLLNNMVNALLPDRGESIETGYFAQPGLFTPKRLDDKYFEGVVSVSFSAFDPFLPPAPQTNSDEGICYHYIGLKTINQPNYNGEDRLKTTPELCNELVESLKVCLSLSGKRKLWKDSVKKLESDINFAEMNLCSLSDVAIADDTEDKNELGRAALSVFSRLSSGHAIVLLTLTKLIETVEEKTLVLIDEPESHLHPPLLSAFTRALSDLLLNRNGVAIVATHSPVVLQEVPKTCVSILRRTRLIGGVERPESETFGENVGTLTREVFGLELSKSGFRNLLKDSVDYVDVNTGESKSYEEILQEYGSQLGDEARVILKGMIFRRDNAEGQE